MKKLLILGLSGVLILGLGIMSFADAFSSPGQVYADLAGVTVAEAYELKGSNQSFGDLAKENGFWDDFVTATIAGKKSIVEARVADGTLLEEDAAEIIAQIESCDGSQHSRLGQFFSMRFGRNSETRGFYGDGNQAQNGEFSEDAPRYGLQDGQPQQRSETREKNGTGRGHKVGQGNN